MHRVWDCMDHTITLVQVAQTKKYIHALYPGWKSVVAAAAENQKSTLKTQRRRIYTIHQAIIFN